VIEADVTNPEQSLLAGRARVRDLLVAGREVVRDGWLLTVDERALAERVRAVLEDAAPRAVSAG
jgi:hypothetical protein